MYQHLDIRLTTGRQPSLSEKVCALLRRCVDIEIVGGRWCGVRVALQGGEPLPVLYLRAGHLDDLAGYNNTSGRPGHGLTLIEFHRLGSGPGYKYAEAGTCGV
jgi:hypothetical protein